LATGTLAATLPLPTSLLGTEVQIRHASTGNEESAQLLFVSPGQINFIVPGAIPEGSAEVKITNSQGVVRPAQLASRASRLDCSRPTQMGAEFLRATSPACILVEHKRSNR
jgi:uncharacterized protein (TIGR03437 family)